MGNNFVHLHVHTQYSLLDGAARIKDAVAKAKELGMPALAITDHGVMYGALTFYKEAKKAGIKPIIGCEVYVAARTMADREQAYDQYSYHLVLLAKDREGYANLCKLVSMAYVDGFYYKPRVDKEALRKHSKGLIALSACLAGELPRTLLKNMDEDNLGPIPQENIDAAREVVREYLDIFGEGNYYIELQNHLLGAQRATNPIMAQIAKEMGVPIVATNDAHYINREDADFQDILLCVQTGRLKEEQDRMRFETQEFYLKSREEMEQALGEYPEALDNTLEIAEKCNMEFEFGKLYMPIYQVPEGYTIDTYLTELCYKGLYANYEEVTQDLIDRLEYELGVIRQMGFLGYFLIVWDIVNFCRQNGILTGPGRGSAAGSIVAYTLGITNIDPIRFNLIFERFLNPERISMPDIDTDFCYVRRGEVIDYLVQKYGADRVGQIVTFGTMKAKLVVRDVGRVLNMPYAEVDAVAKAIPGDLGMTIEKALEMKNSDLKRMYDENPQVHQLVDYSKKLEGMPRHCSTHAAGVVIAQDPIVNYMPVQKIGDGIIATQFEKDQVEEQGLLKMDILGLRTLTVIGDAVQNIELSTGQKIDINRISLDDEKTYKMLQDGDSDGVFQLESDGMKGIMRSLNPERIDDLIALVALYRPGPLGSGMVEDFIDRKHGKKKVVYDHPLLEPILRDTYGVMLYQEQVMQVANVLAGFTLGQSDNLRRIMGKKKPEYLPPERIKFLEGCKKVNNIDEKTAGKIFDLMEYFSGYGFNKSHSAAYAVITYQTAWLKCNYPVEYMAALLTSIMDTADKVPFYIEVCHNMGINVYPPDINESFINFTVVGKAIRFGMAAVKNVGREAVQAIIDERTANGPFKDYLDLCSRVAFNRKTLESLIRCGALDCLGCKRSQMLEVIDQALEIGRKEAATKSSNQMSLFDFGLDAGAAVTTYDLQMPDIAEYSELERLAMEKEMLGFYISGHPVSTFADVFAAKNAQSVQSCLEQESGSAVRIGGLISNLRTIYTKKGDAMATFNLEDTQTHIRSVLFPKSYQTCRQYLQEGSVVIVNGKVDKRDDEAQLIVDKIVPVQRLFIRLSNAEDTGSVTDAMALVKKYPGRLPVSLFFDDINKYRDLSAEYNVDKTDELLFALRERFGAANVVVK